MSTTTVSFNELHRDASDHRKRGLRRDEAEEKLRYAYSEFVVEPTDLKAALDDVYPEPQTESDDMFREPTDAEKAEFAAREVTQTEIEKLELVNEELLADVDDPDFVLPAVPNGSDEDRLATLRTINQILVDKINAEDKAKEIEEDKPKFGRGLAVNIELKGRPSPVWIDENLTDIDTGEKYNLSPKDREYVKAKIEKRRAEKADEFIQGYDGEKQPHSHYAMTEEDYDRESEKEYPVYVLPKQPGPAWDDSILYGASGKLITKMGEYNEAHPAGLLVDFLVSIGSIIGRGPYFNIGATKHYSNEFMARVGDSSRARKGTGRDAIDEVLKLVDPTWYSNRIESGFGSGEAIVNSIRDTVVETKLNHRTGNWDKTTVPGVDDKRLCIRESELASVFVLAGKPESRAGFVIRDGWDGKPLHNIVKGKTRDGFSNSAKCEEPHLSISGDTTISELRQKMPTGADENGFGNRFIYVYVYRVKDCPQGSPALDWAPEALYFHKVVTHAKQVKHVSMSDQARKWWNNVYSKIENERPDGLAGKFTNRAAAHIRRIAMLYCLIDLSSQIELQHFHAAKKLWDYCEESAMYIFGGYTKEQMRIVQWVNQRGPVTFKQVREDLYRRNKPAADIRADLDSLVKSRHLFLNSGVYATGQNVGRLVA